MPLSQVFVAFLMVLPLAAITPTFLSAEELRDQNRNDAGTVNPVESRDLPGSEKIYRCDRQIPFFTNKASYGCEEYEPRGAVRVAPNGMMFLEAPRTASTGSPETSDIRLQRSAGPDIEQSGLCQLYDEWVALNERTSGGFFYQNTAQTARWFALSRIFSSIGAPTASARCGR